MNPYNCPYCPEGFHSGRDKRYHLWLEHDRGPIA